MLIYEFINIVKNNKQVFLTGAGGTGKSYTVNLLRKYINNVVYLSSTNISAQIIGADTYHSFFKLGISENFEQLKGYDNNYISWYIKSVFNNESKARDSLYKDMKQIISASELIIIDEVSMMSSIHLDLIYYRLEILEDIYGITIPPILFVGDLLQLPPVKGEMVFRSRNWNPKIVELTEIKRTENENLMKVLKRVRVGKYTEYVFQFVESVKDNKVPEYATRLCPTNKQVDLINFEKLKTISGEIFTFDARVNTKIKNNKQIESILKSFLTPKTLIIKKGVPVIFTANEKPLYYNGQRGVVTDITDDGILVTSSGQTHTIRPYKFVKNKTVIDVHGNVTLVPELEFIQYPIKLSWAISIHKSQGTSLDNIIINCDKMFGKSMFYVALSRATNMNGIKILDFKSEYVRSVNKESLDYLESKDILKISKIEDESPLNLVKN